jgi:hypothetical protein
MYMHAQFGTRISTCLLTLHNVFMKEADVQLRIEIHLGVLVE